MSDTKKITIKELATMLNADPLATSGFVNVLVGQGVIKEAGNRARPEGSRGKPAKEYEIPNEVLLVFWKDVPENTDTPEPSDAPTEIIEVPAENVAEIVTAQPVTAESGLVAA